MKKLNQIFFGEDEIHISDSLWMYGGCSAFIITTITMMIITL